MTHDEQQSQNTRRSLLRLGAAGLAGAPLLPALVACSSGSGSTPRGEVTAPATPGAAGSTPGGTPGTAGGGADVRTTALAKLSDVPVGESRVVGLSGKKVVLTRTAADTVVAFTAICTHQGCELAPGGGGLACPCHHSLFDGASGAVRRGPATRPLDPIPVTVRGDAVYPA